MSTIVTEDGAEIFYKDWSSGQPIVFSHGWPLTADAWDAQMLFFGQRGFRVIAHDRRGHGRSSQTWHGNTMDNYADDLHELMETLDLEDVVMVGHSTGGGEVTRYLGRHGSDRVAKACLLGAVPPLMLQTPRNPEGTPKAVFDGFREALVADRSKLFLDTTVPFYGFNRPGAQPSEGLKLNFWRQGMAGAMKSHYDCIEQFSETDFTEDLRSIEIPTLVAHGDDDQIVPLKASAALSAKLLPKATLKLYPGLSHGLAETHAEVFNKDLLAFIKD
jgi:non-heme chloroperoxidase